jgi:DnaJ-class molecular chaperone
MRPRLITCSECSNKAYWHGHLDRIFRNFVKHTQTGEATSLSQVGMESLVHQLESEADAETPPEIFSIFINKLKCSNCGSKSIKLEFSETLQERPQTTAPSHETSKYDSCPACNGDGLEGRCSVCYGSGFAR